MDGPRWSIILNFPLCSPLIRSDRHGPSTIRIFLRYAAIQSRYIVCLPAVLNVHDNLRRRLRLIGPSIKRIQTEPNRFAPFESILYRTVFRMWWRLEDSDVSPQNEFSCRLRSLSGHLRRRQHSERNPGHNECDNRGGLFHSATLVHTSESCLDFCSFRSQKTGRNPSVQVIFNTYETTFSNSGAFALSCTPGNPDNPRGCTSCGSVEGWLRKVDPLGRYRVLLRPW